MAWTTLWVQPTRKQATATMGGMLIDQGGYDVWANHQGKALSMNGVSFA